MALSSLGAGPPALFLGYDLTYNHAYHIPLNPDGSDILDAQHLLLPAADLPGREWLRRFISQRVAVLVPDADPATWLEGCPFYYKPDDQGELCPVEFKLKVEELYTLEQARKVWKENGRKYLPRSPLSTKNPPSPQVSGIKFKCIC